jgi:MFS superfamily sulfate permease-like transporter
MPGCPAPGATREPGILVLRLEGPLFYANVGIPRLLAMLAT